MTDTETTSPATPPRPADTDPTAAPEDDPPAAETDSEAAAEPVPEVGGRDGPDPTRYGDWEKQGRCIDF